MPQTSQPVEDGQLLHQERLDDPAPGIALYLVTYGSQGLRVKGYLAIPQQQEQSGETPAPLPGLVYCRGGIRRVGMVRIARIVTLARRGYVVMAPFYRGNEGGDGREDFAGEDRYDLYHAIALLRSLPQVTADPVGLIGFSRGAMMALLAARDCEGVGAVAVWGGVSDLLLTYEERVDLRRMLKRVVGHPVKDEKQYKARSPVCWAGDIRSPVLIIHGSIDEHVGVAHAYRLAEALEAAGNVYQLRVFENRPHVFPREEDESILDLIFSWMEQHRQQNS